MPKCRTSYNDQEIVPRLFSYRYSRSWMARSLPDRRRMTRTRRDNSGALSLIDKGYIPPGTNPYTVRRSTNHLLNHPLRKNWPDRRPSILPGSAGTFAAVARIWTERGLRRWPERRTRQEFQTTESIWIRSDYMPISHGSQVNMERAWLLFSFKNKIP